MPILDREHAIASLVKVYGQPGNWGMGFASSGGHIITAAHCLPRLPALNEAVLWEPLDVAISDFRQPPREATVAVLSVDPCQDIAVLSPPKDDEEVSQGLVPVPLFLQEPHYKVPIRVQLYTHWGEWLTGTCQFFWPTHTGFLVTIAGVSRDLSGTSGAPIFAENGEVLGILSNSNVNGEIHACAVRLATALPHWVLMEEGWPQAESESDMDGDND